jgi:hypothetical protein
LHLRPDVAVTFSCPSRVQRRPLPAAPGADRGSRTVINGLDVADFQIAVPDADLEGLHRRLAANRWPRRWPNHPGLPAPTRSPSSTPSRGTAADSPDSPPLWPALVVEEPAATRRTRIQRTEQGSSADVVDHCPGHVARGMATRRETSNSLVIVDLTRRAQPGP